jgi:diketogulonate reductase-like aldo/keto reductase
MGEEASRRADEVRALQLGLDLGMTMIDTAEMYAEGGAEEVVGEAIAGRRSQVYLVSKVYPHNATRRGVQEACERSLKRLKTDYLNLYLLHWRGNVPLAETLEGFEALKRDGKIRDYGVSNFDVGDMEEAQQHNATPAQIALAWLAHQDGVVAIPKAVQPDHVRANRAALDIRLGAADLAVIDKAFPPPRRKLPLDML